MDKGIDRGGLGGIARKSRVIFGAGMQKKVQRKKL